MTSMTTLMRPTLSSLSSSYFVVLVYPALWSRFRLLYLALSTGFHAILYSLSPILYISHGNFVTVPKGLSHAMLQSWSHIVTLSSCDTFFRPVSRTAVIYLGFSLCVFYLVTTRSPLALCDTSSKYTCTFFPVHVGNRV